LEESGRLLLKAAEIEGMARERRVHFLNPNAVRLRRSLGDRVGLTKLGVHLVEIEPGRVSTEFHIHYDEEECVYVLAGRGMLELGDETFELGAGDFLGLPAGKKAYAIRNDGKDLLVFLLFGQRLPHDVAEYPRLSKRLFRHRGTWSLADLADLSDPRDSRRGA